MCICVFVCVLCCEKSKPITETEDQDPVKLISDINTLQKPLWTHFVRINLPPDSHTGYLYLSQISISHYTYGLCQHNYVLFTSLCPNPHLLPMLSSKKGTKLDVQYNGC